MDTTQMLMNINQLTLYSYLFELDSFGGRSKNDRVTKEVGLLAQDVETIIPDAVKSTVCLLWRNIIIVSFSI